MNEIKIHFNNCSLINKSDAFKLFNNNGYYFTDLFIKNCSTMEFNGIKIPTNDKKVAITPNHGDATVRLKKEDVIIIFDEKYFILWKNEFVRVAVKILEQVFEGYFDFKISTNMTGALYARFSLKGGENYEVSCQRYYTFIDIVSQISMPLPMDYFVTAEKAQKTLSNLKLGDEKQYEKIIIYDNNKQQIDDKNFQLKNLSNPKLYFSVGPNQKSSVATTQNINKLTTQYLDSPPVGYQQPGSTQPKAPFVYYPKLDELKSSDNGTKQSSSNSNEENQSPLLRYNTGTKLVIHFICEESVGKKFESFDERIASNMTIGELSNFISNKYGIHGQVKLHYLKDHTEGIEEEKTIKDIIKNLQQKDEKNKINNILYVGRIKSSKSSTKLEPVQPTDVDDDDDVDDDNDNDNENNENKKDHPNKSTKKSKPSIKKMIPKITPVSNDGEKLPESDKGKNKNIIFTFVFNNQEEDISIPSESLLKNQNKKLHQIFDIEPDQKLEFTSQVNGEEEKSIEDENQPMKTFTDKVIHIYIQGEPESTLTATQYRMNKPGAIIIEYRFMTNRSEEEYRVKLDSEATVKSFKRAVARQFKVPNVSNIKVLFAGKVLLDNIILDILEIGDSLVFVYIRSDEDILLLSCYQDQNEKENNDDEYEYEYQYEDDNE